MNVLAGLAAGFRTHGESVESNILWTENLFR